MLTPFAPVSISDEHRGFGARLTLRAETWAMLARNAVVGHTHTLTHGNILEQKAPNYTLSFFFSFSYGESGCWVPGRGRGEGGSLTWWPLAWLSLWQPRLGFKTRRGAKIPQKNNLLKNKNKNKIKPHQRHGYCSTIVTSWPWGERRATSRRGLDRWSCEHGTMGYGAKMCVCGGASMTALGAGVPTHVCVCGCSGSILAAHTGGS